ncbi:MAG: metallophosphatase domain-containing protein [Candidatus Melainabacteria bacterium]|nr:metallophosphatase domain-containing protein [Candidatus Melainabacteria bacterium]
MRIVAISDTHNHEVDLPTGDLLIVAGDVSGTGTFSQLTRFNTYLEKQAPKFKHKPLVIAGNHDFLFQKDRAAAESLLSAGVYIEDELSIIDGFKIYGSPWTPTFYDWAFMEDRGEPIRKYWDLIPEGLDLLVTHGPPLGILDFCGQNVGCADLLAVVTKELAAPPRFHIFGHIHEGHGEFVTEKTKFYNVSICDVNYHPTNPVTIIDL